MKRPMLFSALVGSVVSVLALNYRQLTLLMGIGLIVLIFWMIGRRVRPAMIISLCAVFAICTGTLISYDRIDHMDSLSATSVVATFTALENPVERDGYSTVVVRADEAEELPGGSKLFLFYSKGNIQSGSCFKAEVKLKSLAHSQYRLSNNAEKIYASATAKTLTLLPDENATLSFAQKVRSGISKTLFSNLSEKEASTLIAVTIGDATHFTDDFSLCIRRSGVSHVMVVSGMHLTIIMGGIFMLMERFVYNKYAKAALSLAGVFFITAVCGFNMSIVRAGITFVLASFAILVDRDSDTVNLLGTTVTLVLISSPFAIFNVGFLLSVLSTFGILVITPYVSQILLNRHQIRNLFFRDAWLAGVTTFAATFMTLPVVIYCFGYVSVIAPLTNLLISYPVTLALLLTAAGLVISLVPFVGILAKPFFFAAGLMAKYINYIIIKLGSVPNATVNVDKGVIVVAVAAIIVLLAITQACNKRKLLVQLKEWITRRRKIGNTV